MGIHDKPIFSFDRNQAALNIEIPEERSAEKLSGQIAVLPSKFLESYLSVCAEDNVGVVVVLSSGLARLLPAFLHCQTTQQDSLGRSSSGSTEYLRIFGGVPKLCNWSKTDQLLTHCEKKRYPLMEMQRLWMILAAGYSSKSTIFLLIFSKISLSACSGIHVWTNLKKWQVRSETHRKSTYDAKFRRGFPSKAVSSCKSW